MPHQGKRIKALIVHLQREGATVRMGDSGGVMIYPADKNKPPIAVHSTPSDHRANKNLKRLIERSGHTYPFND